jgi:hypothetical protein
MTNSGEEDIILLQFRTLKSGVVFPKITNCYFNNQQVTMLGNGKIDIKPKGDVDFNQQIQAFDASITLQYSVGLDPIPNIDNRPWDYERFCVADLNNDYNLNAIDASMILNLSYKNNLSDDLNNDINIEIVNNNVVFTSNGNLLALNVALPQNFDALQNPVFNFSDMLTAQNITDSTYQIAVASGNYIPKGTQILQIPINYISDYGLTLDLVVNSKSQTITLFNPNNINGIMDNVRIYPNPAINFITLNNLPQKSIVDIFDINGKIVKSFISDNQESKVDISELTKGIYYVKISNESKSLTYKFIKN